MKKITIISISTCIILLWFPLNTNAQLDFVEIDRKEFIENRPSIELIDQPGVAPQKKK